MKRITLIVLALVLLCGFAACGSASDSSQTQANTSQSAPEVGEGDLPVEDTAESPQTQADAGHEEEDATALANTATEPEDSMEEQGAILIAYFSRSGNTEQIADMIHQRVGGDLFQIVSATQYPEDYDAVLEQAQQEQRDNARPALAGAVEKMANYDTIFIGYPIWWGDTPMAVLSFLEAYDLSGKRVIPFCTHGSSGAGSSYDSVAASAPGANVLDGIAVQGSGVGGAGEQVTQWLNGLGFAQ